MEKETKLELILIGVSNSILSIGEAKKRILLLFGVSGNEAEKEFAIQNALQDKFDEGYCQRMKDEGEVALPIYCECIEPIIIINSIECDHCGREINRQ